ncbi:MAG TPA: DNA mismatch repair endonuclease MutL [Spirochaetota bacterium]|nr:DNA mismatch repair endonuclease MutL [Spirochaetota bacterium]
MNRIRVLSDAVKKKIAAGEVVEGPFSVVKELVENAIDAGASVIDVEVAEGGLTKMLVRDNGCGMPAEDLPLAVREHATSKIVEINDIERVGSYGFRGEALSSISSISRMTISTRTDGEALGARLVASDGSAEVSPFAGPVGTTVIVENLFYNVPARKKFLKAKGTELRYIRETLLGIALALPEISFTLTVDDKRQLVLPHAGTPEQRIRDIYGAETAQGLILEHLADLKAEITGYFSSPSFMRSSRSMQQLYVNRRPIEYPYLGFLLSRAYEGIAGHGSHPAALVFISIDPSLVDVNVHPAKREIKFFDQKYVDSLITSLARKALGGGAHAVRVVSKETAPEPFATLDAADHANTTTASSERAPSRTADEPRRLFGHTAQYDDAVSTQSVIRDARHLYRASEAPDRRVLGVIFGTYLLAEDAESLIIIDFHAAHERMLFDRLMSAEYEPSVQGLAFPVVVELSINEYAIIREQLARLREIGFDIDFMSDTTVSVQGVPDIARGIDPAAFVRDFAESIRTERDRHPDIRAAIMERIACHAAARANDRLTTEDMRALLDTVMNGRHETRCPHGRPFLYRLGRSELEGLFKRS